MAHTVVSSAEEILDREYPVLDKGFIRLVDYMGGDDRIVQAARVSYGAGTKSFRQDAGLIRYLLRNEHTSPFEQVVFTFHAKMPVFVARQWVRHRTARLNEISGRYSVMKDEFYLPDPDKISLQSEDNKQGRSEDAVDTGVATEVLGQLKAGQQQAYAAYQSLIESGLARELARINLPLSMYTEWYWQIDLHNLFHFLRLRLDPHAQYEIRAYAEVMLEIARAVCPVATAAFEEHRRGAVTFSAREFQVLQQVVQHGKPLDQAIADADLQGKDRQRMLDKLETGRQL
ncbi:FAD-dependent thymidylate synthase [Spirochaeta africana]|uniref:Flavin-dependent thymidylate synthase n=1 Tax=Spirochaeta africana (strain ATCC 700263 / DSM 8902 / Z-7692) TaxID=889378 RepID=H9UMU4_SPIAZ|nr:FAD-dependent thymidylate synthase [Spirochaeta africana]AFG38837.1 thymidylate synthase, flavin-dependent [Spirochaeta africana DSM 8902]